jgi:tRNA 2-thiouridine synthesizing protein A
MAETEIHETTVVDARTLLCPMPIVATAKAMKGIAAGEVLKVIATDRGSIADIPAWAETTGNQLLEWHEEGDNFIFFVRKGTEG